MPEPTDTDIAALIEDATFDFSIGDTESALSKLREAIGRAPDTAAAWHAMAEILFQERRFEDALTAAERAHRLEPDDLFINTSLSRIWMELGDKTQAEQFGARARILGWKEQLKD